MVRYIAEMMILLAEFKFKLLIGSMVLIQGLSRVLALAVVLSCHCGPEQNEEVRGALSRLWNQA